ncbi:patatin-like phospholipase family protein [Ottowia testudinis]|uniref:Patatin-like phospholipase family protein n=1 Tax=Ottowia testudinis TaxID=2816950 RepID=A0A975CHK4_9BURK|nr:patatin-like phospholipase family protein [Ottowia testudinis]
MSDTTPKTIHLALQGGGAHGAFTWGVLDALLLDGRLRFAGISGTSAGAVNAVALAHGWAQAVADKQDPHEGARAALARVWGKVMDLGAASESTARLTKLMMGALPGAFTKFSPYQTNPLDYNPLRQLIEAEIDFDRLARLKSPRVFVAATDVETGRAEIFAGRRLTAQAVMASACLPQLFQAPEIDGKTYWDGGYSANPALGPLVEMGETSDILLVQINPLKRAGKATTAAEITDRANDLTFNASLIAQMRTIALLNDAVARGIVGEGLKPLHMHRIDGGAALAEMPAASKISPQRATLEKLFELGQASAARWLKKHFDAVGEKGTVNLKRDYGDPLKLNFEPASDAGGESGTDDGGPDEAALQRFRWSPEEQRTAADVANQAAAAAVRAAGGQVAEREEAVPALDTQAAVAQA